MATQETAKGKVARVEVHLQRLFVIFPASLVKKGFEKVSVEIRCISHRNNWHCAEHDTFHTKQSNYLLPPLQQVRAGVFHMAFRLAVPRDTGVIGGRGAGQGAGGGGTV